MYSSTLLRQSWRSWLGQVDTLRGPRWLQYLWTFVFSAGLAVGFTIVGFVMFGSGEGAWRNLPGWWYWYRQNLVVALCCGYAIHLLFDLGRGLAGASRIRAFGAWQRLLFFAGTPLVGVALGWPLGLWLVGVDLPRWFDNNNANSIAGSLLFSLLLIFLFYQFFAARSRQFDAERRAAEARLQLLQAQIEPHFLFNTLANVVGLMEVDTPRARLMLESFIDYLRSSLGTLRLAEHTLGEELELVDAYLRVVKIRMDDRLGYTIDVPDVLRRLPLPALSLQPLVENAIVHGLEPKIDGGHVTVAARELAGVLRLTVVDDGLGLTATPRVARRTGSGTALANIRERLLGAFGERAVLRIEPVSASGGGVRATLELPMGRPADRPLSPEPREPAR